jgi:polar amino acid transport system ATP-binding protein
MTMVMVTHEMGFARKVADQIVFMHEGKAWECGPPAILAAPGTQELRQFVQSEL